MRSRWQRARGDEQHAPVEMRFIDMFMTALGSLVFLALILVFLLPKTTQSQDTDEKLKKALEENEQLKKQIQQQVQPSLSPGATEDKNVFNRWFGVMLITKGCRSEEPQLYVRTEAPLVNFKTDRPTGEAIQFNAANVTNRTILVGQRYFDIGTGGELPGSLFSGLGGSYTAGLDLFRENNLHEKLFLAVSRPGIPYSVYVGLSDLSRKTECNIYPVFLSASGLIVGDKLVLTRQRPFAWLRRFKINPDGSTTLLPPPSSDTQFQHDLEEFSKKQSQALCDSKSICGTIDAEYALLVPPPPTPAQVHYQTGVTYQEKGDFDHAIAEFSEAVKTDANYATAFFARGNAYIGKANLDRAVDDFSKAIEIEPTSARYEARGVAQLAKAERDRAIADLTEAIRTDPNNANAYIYRGFAYLDKGSFALAASDFRQAHDLRGDDVSAALWLDLAERSDNIPTHLSEYTRHIDSTVWPGPIVQLFLGKATLAQTLDAAESSDQALTRKEKCDAYLYGGEFALAQGTSKDAQNLLQLATETCAHYSFQWAAANSELKRAHEKSIRTATAEKERQSYRAAHGNLELLERYLRDCSICAFKNDAPNEIESLKKPDERDKRTKDDAAAYHAAKGNADLLHRYLRECTVCAFRNDAKKELAATVKTPAPASLPPTTAPTGSPRPGFWEYQGSSVSLTAHDAKRSVSIDNPTEKLAAMDVRKGTLLFLGTRSGDKYEGTAYSFSKGCKPTSYSVSGTVSSDDRRVVLNGKAPVRDEKCSITGYRDESIEFIYHDQADNWGEAQKSTDR